MAQFYLYSQATDDTLKDLAPAGHPVSNTSSNVYQYPGVSTALTVVVSGGNFQYNGNTVVSGNPTFILGLDTETPMFELRFGGVAISDLIGLPTLQQMAKIFVGDDYILGSTFTATNDKLQGFAGDDTIDGSLGVDAMYGGAGDDIFIVDQVGDKAFERSGEGVDLVKSSVNYSMAGQFVNNLTLTGTANIAGNGNALANTMIGNSGNNLLIGGAGDDQLIGGDGNDRLISGLGIDRLTGGSGNDKYLIHDASDRVIEAANSGLDTVQSRATHKMAANLENLVLIGSSGIDGFGNELNNSIIGNAGNNDINGRAGNDLINGALGNDLLRGAAGNDTFLFNTRIGSLNVDNITDFSTINDTIRLENGIFKGLAAGELKASEFKDVGLAGASVDANDHILYNNSTGRLFYDPDGSGAAKAVLFATLDNRAIITADDFFIV